jgi:hypothetical protein
VRPECLKCGHDINLDEVEFPYSDGVACPACGTEHETDWEIINDDDDETWWIAGIKEADRGDVQGK